MLLTPSLRCPSPTPSRFRAKIQTSGWASLRMARDRTVAHSRCRCGNTNSLPWATMMKARHHHTSKGSSISSPSAVMTTPLLPNMKGLHSSEETVATKGSTGSLATLSIATTIVQLRELSSASVRRHPTHHCSIRALKTPMARTILV